MIVDKLTAYLNFSQKNVSTVEFWNCCILFIFLFEFIMLFKVIYCICVTYFTIYIYIYINDYNKSNNYCD